MYNEKRYNVFNNIHKALRGMLFDLQTRIQRTDFTDPAAGTIINELEQVLNYFDEHGEMEDTYILANITALEPQIAKALEDDHVIDHELGEQLRTLIAGYRSGTESAKAARDIFYAFNEFIAFNLYHMNKEEKRLLPLLWHHFTDMEILAMEHQIVANVDPQVLQEESRWMMRSINNTEIKGWLAGIKRGAPAPVYNAFVAMAAEELSDERFADLALAPISFALA